MAGKRISSHFHTIFLFSFHLGSSLTCPQRNEKRRETRREIEKDTSWPGTWRVMSWRCRQIWTNGEQWRGLGAGGHVLKAAKNCPRSASRTLPSTSRASKMQFNGCQRLPLCSTSFCCHGCPILPLDQASPIDHRSEI